MLRLAFLFLQIAALASGQGVARDLFDPGEMDLHLHAGLERPVDLAAWLDLAVADGRKVLALVDHIELYRKSPAEYVRWRAERGFQARYAMGAAGHREVLAAFHNAAKRRGVIVFTGWEISEKELDSGLEEEPMRLVDMIGWHISPNHGGKPPDGRSLIRRVEQVREVQRRFPVPMVLFHPFPMRLEHLQRAAKQQGRDPRSITAAEYRFFQPGEQERLAALLKGTSIYLEISRATEEYFDDPACREALIADTRPLAEAGVQFVISTDNHNLRDAQKPFRPQLYCEALGVNARNTNAIVRELLALRTRNARR